MADAKETPPRLPEDFEEKLIRLLRKNAILVSILDNIVITFLKTFVIFMKALLIVIAPFKTKKEEP